MVSRHRSGAPRRRSVRTLRKVAGGGRRQTLLASCKSRWARQASWSIILFWLRISGCSVDLPITAYLPEEYVPDDVVRLRLYQRMAASMTPSQIRDLRKELEDRFGPLPEPAANLLEVVHLKGLAIAAGVESIRALANEFVLQTPEDLAIPEPLRMRLQHKYINTLKVSPHQVRILRAQAGAKWQEVLTGVLEEMGEETNYQ